MLQTSTESQVEAIQKVAATASRDIQAIVARIQEIDGINSSVAAAAEQQGAATAEISRSIHNASVNTQSIATSVQGITDTATTIGAANMQTKSAARELFRASESLQTGVKTVMQKAKAL